MLFRDIHKSPYDFISICVYTIFLTYVFLVLFCSQFLIELTADFPTFHLNVDKCLILEGATSNKQAKNCVCQSALILNCGTKILSIYELKMTCDFLFSCYAKQMIFNA